MSKATRNTFSNKNYRQMWCKHIRAPFWSGSAGSNMNVRATGTPFLCMGTQCPDLMFVDKDGEDWVGYCGATRK